MAGPSGITSGDNAEWLLKWLLGILAMLAMGFGSSYIMSIKGAVETVGVQVSTYQTRTDTKMLELKIEIADLRTQQAAQNATTNERLLSALSRLSALDRRQSVLDATTAGLPGRVGGDR